MEILVLGPVQAKADGRRLPLDGPITESLLAALAAEADRVVPVDALVDVAWETDPPRTVRRQIGNRLASARRTLVEAGFPADVLSSDGSGYILRSEGIRLDLTQFQRAARAAAAPGAQLPTSQMREALALWRGPAFAGLDSSRLLAIAHRLSEERLALWEQCLTQELAAGDHERIVADLVGLHNMFPARERFAQLLMLALYRSGRQGDALSVFRATRDHLIDEHGLSPSRELQSLHDDVLRDSPRLRLAVHPAGEHREALPAMPQQLPRDVPGFTGRADALAQLDAYFAQHGKQGSGSIVISAVAGTGGVGKTALAVHWAQSVRGLFPHGQLYVNLRGFDPSGAVMAPAEAIRRFLGALAVPSQRIPADPEAQVDLYRSLLADKRVLVVLDNARDPDQVRPLLPGAPGCLVLITSRNRLGSLVAAEGAQVVPLDLLTHEEARDLLARRLGSARVEAEPAAVDEIITHCDRLPLALAIVAASAATQPSLSLAALAGQLRHNRHRLDALSTNDAPATDLRSVFSWSYRALREDSARLFRLLGLFPGPSISAPAAASLAATPLDRARALLDGLAGAHLINEHMPGRYALHDLLRTYAAELTHTIDPEPERREATGRILDHYLHSGVGAARLLNAHREALTLSPPRPGVSVEEPADHHRAIDWFTAEHQVLLAAVDFAAGTGFDGHTWRLACTLDTFLNRKGQWHDWATTGQAAVAAADRLAEAPAQARAHRNIARAHLALGRLDQAHTHLRQALELSVACGDPVGQADTHLRLANVCERQGRNAEALGHSQRSLDLYQQAGHGLGQALALNAVGWYEANLGNYVQTLHNCQQALTLLQKLDNLPGQAATWGTIGYAHHHLARPSQAIDCYQQAIELYRSLGDRYYVADSLVHLGDAQCADDNADAARDSWQQALTILEELGHSRAQQVRAKIASLDKQHADTR